MVMTSERGMYRDKIKDATDLVMDEIESELNDILDEIQDWKGSDIIDGVKYKIEKLIDKVY